MTDAKKTAKGTNDSEIWTDAERAAMKEHAKEQKAAAKRGNDEAAGEADVLAKIAEMSDSDRAIAERIHAIVKDTAPTLTAKTYYGMPAYARDGKVVCFFQPKDKFKARYGTLGFNDDARLDDGTMWPTSWAIAKLTAADEKRIVELVKKAVS